MESHELQQRPASGRERTDTKASGIATPWPWWMLLVALPCVSVAVFSMRYLVAIGPFPPGIVANAFAHPWLVIHVAGAATALLVGPFQFLQGLRRASPRLHRWLGRTYVAGCAIGGISGIALALGATTGGVSTTGFGLLAIAWLATTGIAWKAALQRKFDAHRAWMLRSFALTLAAVTLRVYLVVLEWLPLAFQDGYRAISFLCWVPNLVLAEVYLRRTLKRPPSRSA